MWSTPTLPLDCAQSHRLQSSAALMRHSTSLRRRRVTAHAQDALHPLHGVDQVGPGRDVAGLGPRSEDRAQELVSQSEKTILRNGHQLTAEDFVLSAIRAGNGCGATSTAHR